MPVWPYALKNELANSKEIFGSSFLMWLVPTGPPHWTNGVQFPIVERWFDLYVPDGTSHFRYDAGGRSHDDCTTVEREGVRAGREDQHIGEDDIVIGAGDDAV